MPKKDNHVYAFYKGEEVISIGTKKELAKNLNLKMNTITYYVSNTYKERCEKESKYNTERIEVIDIGED